MIIEAEDWFHFHASSAFYPLVSEQDTEKERNRAMEMGLHFHL